MESTATSNRRIRLISPVPGTVDDFEKQTLEISVWTSADDFRAYLNGRDVSARFDPPVDGLRRAQFERGKDFEPGPGAFMAAVGAPGTDTQETAGFHFTAWEIIDGSGPEFFQQTGGPLLAKRALVNGQTAFEHPGFGRPARARSPRYGLGFDLTADDGLGFGANTIVVDMPRIPYVLQRVKHCFDIPRTAPLVGAGRDQIVAAGHVADLNGANTRAALEESSLHFSWSIIGGPEGANAEIADAGRPHARFLAHTPGRYRIRLDVTEQPRGSSPDAALGLTNSAEIEIAVKPTADPMGIPIETLNERFATRIGNTEYGRADKWLRILVFDETVLTLLSDTAYDYSPSELKSAKEHIDGLSGNEIVIVLAWKPEAEDFSKRWFPKSVSSLAEQTFQDLIAAIGGAPQTPDGWALLSNSRFSVIGRKGLSPGQAWQNSCTPTTFNDQFFGEGGRMKGYLQMVNGNAYSFVSPDAVAIDTAAEGSDGYTRNSVRVGDNLFHSEEIANGATAVQLVVLNSDLERVANMTFTVFSGKGAVDGEPGQDVGNGKYGSGVKGLAAAMEYYNRKALAGNLVLILQTFGQGPWWANTPSGSPSWVNDNVRANDLRSWDGRHFVESDGSDNPAVALYDVWNPGYPTVAGQVGILTSGAGHDLVANFGQWNQGVPNGGLTVVATTHPYDGRQNFVQGQTGMVKSQPRMVGTLIRTRQYQWTVQTGTTSPKFEVTRFWQAAFGAGKSWLCAQGAGYKAAMTQIASALWGHASGITDVRPQYVLRKSADWDGLAQITQEMRYPDGASFTKAEFETLRDQLATEMHYVAAVKNLVVQLTRIFRDSTFSGYVDLQTLARVVIDNALANAQHHAKEEAGLDWLGIIGYALGVSESILGFTPLGEIAAPLGLAANVFGLASAVMPSEQTGGETRPDSQKIWNRADLLAQSLLARFNRMVDTLGHIEDILISNWGKLETAGFNANGSWAFGTYVQRTLMQAFTVSTKRVFYEALLPLTYEQWVISPAQTDAQRDSRCGPEGLVLPGRAYKAWGNGDHPLGGPKTHPFDRSPDGALHYGGVHGFDPPGSITPPAAASQVWFEIRVLKSKDDPMKVIVDGYRGNNPTIWEVGSNPPANLVDPLFQPVDPADVSGNPIKLGMDKTRFFGDFNRGWGWRRAVAS